jgi:hypothetical protein
MKSLAFLSTAASASLVVLGGLFKIQHWPGASIMLVLGLGMLALVGIPSMAAYLYQSSK